MKTQVIMDLMATGAVDLLDSLPVAPEKIDAVVGVIDSIRDEYKTIDTGYKKLFTQFSKGENSIAPNNPQFLDFINARETYTGLERQCTFDAVFTEAEIKAAAKITPAQFRAIKAAGLIKQSAPKGLEEKKQD